MQAGLGTWGEEIPVLQEHASRLLSLSNEIISSPVEYDATDHLGAMIDMFTHGQIDHLKSICMLIDAAQYQDAAIIARTSYEKMGLLLWASHGPTGNFRDSRPFQWFAYEYIDRYFQMKRYHQLGIEPKPETEKVIRQGIQEFADLFLTKNASKDIESGKVVPEKKLFRDRTKFGNMVDELMEAKLIDKEAHQRYTMLSQLPHGTSQSMGIIFCYDGRRISPDKNICKSLGADAFIIGIRSLGDTIILFNNYFKLSFHDRLTKIRDGFSNYLLEMKSRGLF